MECTRSPEPSPRAAPSAPEPRFAILEHDHPRLHWDFLLESAGALRSWRLAAPPALRQPVAATPIPDHRLLYLEYEGPISGNRGHVTRWDAGTFTWVEDAPTRVCVSLRGGKVRGRATLELGQGGGWVMTIQDTG